MTKEEAIESFKYSNKQAKLRLEVEKMRMDSGEIKELEFYIERDEMAIKALEQEPCEDCISRENTLKAMIEQLGIRNEDYLIPAEATLYKVVKRMPPVTPQPKTGHWIAYEVQLPDRTILNYRCSVCGRKLIGYNTETLSEAPFCHCGAKMVDPQESEG